MAWSAFYEHMQRLGRPVSDAPIPQITLGNLADQYGTWMEKEVSEGRMRRGTLTYYRDHIQKFLNTIGGNRGATAILPIELERYKTNWHSVQTIQRLFNWGNEMGLISVNQFKTVKRPEPGERQRILTREELIRLLRAADCPFRHFLWAMIHTIARPQEVRAFQWKHLALEPVPMFELTDYKAKRLRKKNRKGDTRKILLDHLGG